MCSLYAVYYGTTILQLDGPEPKMEAVLDYIWSFWWMQNEDLEYLAEANVTVLDCIWSFDLWMQGEDLD